MNAFKRVQLSERLIAWEEWRKANHNAHESARKLGLEFSDEDADLRSVCWSFNPHTGYAFTRFRINGRREFLAAHQIVANRKGLYPTPLIDHDDGNRMNCRRDNLLAASLSGNCRNIHKDTFVGIYQCTKNHRKWWSRIRMKVGGKEYSAGLGPYSTPERAAFAYNQLAQLFGFKTRNAVPIPTE